MNLAGLSIRLTVVAALFLSTPVLALTPRQILTEAAFRTRDKDAALAQIGEAERAAAARMARDPSDREAAMMRAMAMGYRGKLRHSRGDAMAARHQFETLSAAEPRDPEAMAAIGTWHLDSVLELGGFVAGMAIGAKKGPGIEALDRAVALGGKRAFYPGLAGLLRLAIDPDDARGRALIRIAAEAPAPEPLDRILQGSAAAMQGAIRSGNSKAIEKLARQLLPFGRLDR
jgi:hypothetical protein